MGKAGRHSKILNYGLSSEIERLRSSGMTYLDIAREINSRHPEVSISKDTVFRFLKGETKQLVDVTPIQLVEDFRRFMSDAFFHLDAVKSLAKEERRAIVNYLRRSQTNFESKLRRSKESGQLVSDYDKICRLLIDFANLLCPECRRKVSKLALEEIERHKESM